MSAIEVRRFSTPERYGALVERMRRLADDVAESRSPGEIWLLEHAPVITRGRRTAPGAIFAPPEIEVVDVDRGGEATWHGPGQLVVYPIVKLASAGLGPTAIREWVDLLLATTIGALAAVGVRAERRPEIGVFTDAGKIASLGIRVERGVSMHGISVNVRLAPNGFVWIDPCGVRGARIDEVANHDASATVASIGDRWIAAFSDRVALERAAAA